MAKAKKTLDEKTIDQLTGKLAHFLADTFVLYVKTLNYHWNMVGPAFFMYHRLLEEQYKELAEASDTLAERIRQLGRICPATLGEYLKLTSLKEGKATTSQDGMIRELAEDHEKLEEALHQIIDFADNVLDQGTSDLFIDRIRAHSKAAWLLRSHFARKKR